MDQLPEEERKCVTQEIAQIIKTLKEEHPRARITEDGILEAVMAAMYYDKYLESPIKTIVLNI